MCVTEASLYVALGRLDIHHDLTADDDDLQVTVLAWDEGNCGILFVLLHGSRFPCCGRSGGVPENAPLDRYPETPGALFRWNTWCKQLADG